MENPVYKDGFAYIENSDSNILLSAPHGVVQTRLGRQKFPEKGSARLAVILSQINKTNLIIKTQNMFDDVNFDDNSNYKDKISKEIEKEKVKYIFDIHGLAAKRNCDINLGINFGDNIKSNKNLYEEILKILQNAGFKVNIDNPFCGRYPSISATFAKKYNIWTIQIEVNCAITNKLEHIEKLNKLIETLSQCIQLCN